MVDILEMMRESSKRLQDPLQIKMMREIIEPSFKELLEHTEKMYIDLEKRVYDEIANRENDFEIFTTLIPRNELNYQSLYLSPILHEDKENLNSKEILKKLKEGKAVVLEKLFCPLSDEEIERIIFENKEYEAFLIYKDIKCKIKIILEKPKAYEEKEEILYKLFYKNNLPWRSINNPYTKKMLEVVLVKVSGDIDEIEEIEGIGYENISFPYERDRVPVWNIIEGSHQVTSGIDPAEDTLNHYYSLFSEELKDNENQVLAYNDETNIKAIFRENNGEIKIVCDNDNVLKWNLFIFRNIESYKLIDSKFEIFRNNKTNSFDKFKGINGIIIRTKAEIIRVVELYGKEYGIGLSHMEISDNSKGMESSINNFIKDDIIAGKNQGFLVLYFTVERQNYITKNLIEFILAQLQLFMTHFHCRGIIV